MRLPDVLALRDGDVIAFVGAGGKTTAMFRLAHELRDARVPVVVTTTTKIVAPDADASYALIVETDRARLVSAAADAIKRGQIPVAGTSIMPERKLVGVHPDWVEDLRRMDARPHVLVEADGARRLPITAPREGEPVIPPAATLVVAVVGADALGARIDEVAHRPERVVELTGLRPDEVLDARAIARVVLGPNGNTRGTPAGARTVAIVNKVDDAARLIDARAIAAELARFGVARIVLAALGSRPGAIEVMEVSPDGQTAASARTVRRASR